MTSAPVQAAPCAARPADPGFDRARAVADAVLYEGYLLYPYRRSSAKNRVRWQFGVVAPRAWVEADGPVVPQVAGSAECWRQQTECLLTAEDPRTAVLHVRVRYLQVQHKQIERRADDGRYEPVESLRTGGQTHLGFDEAVPREADLVVPLAELLAGEREFEVGAAAGEETEELAQGARAVRRRHPVLARTALWAEALDAPRPAYRLRVRTENTGTATAPDAPREEALRHCLVAAHTLIGGSGVAFLSLTDPPRWAEAFAKECRNLHTFPVPAGGTGTHDVLLSSPIILPDHPRVAPESPGDLHDAAEIDEILSLRTLLLTDEEKREVRATDRRAAEILDRVEAMPEEVFARLHGAIRSLRPVGPAAGAEPAGPEVHVEPATPEPAGPEARAEPATPAPPVLTAPPEAARRPPGLPGPPGPWWREDGGDGGGKGGGGEGKGGEGKGGEGVPPDTESVLVDGVELARGSTVRLCPRRRGTDAQDMFLDGRDARVEAVRHDVDGSVHLAVTVLDDPAADLHGWYGRFHYFRPDEVRPATPGR
jgi:hypothetical protein